MTAEPILLAADRTPNIHADWGHLTWYASAALGNSDYLTLGRCVIYPGQSNPRHYHPNCDEILTVLQGVITHTWKDDQDVEMKAGDTITIPAGLTHRARNIGSDDAVLLTAFTSPDRQTVGEAL